MPASMDCYLCLLRQSLEAARLASNDEALHQKVLFTGMRYVLGEDPQTPPPMIGRAIHRLIRSLADNPDPYRAEKERSNAFMLAQFDTMKERIRSAADPLEAAVRLAIAGNSIDCALGLVKQEAIDRAFDQAFDRPINGPMDRFRAEVCAANRILYITDNAGEIVCDRLLIEELTETFGQSVTVAVRGRPIINDATREDAEAVGLAAAAEIIDNGNDGLGTFLDECSEEFLTHFTGDSLVIAKGLANYETLVENETRWQPKKIAFLFKAKCPFISHFSGTQLGDLTIRII